MKSISSLFVWASLLSLLFTHLASAQEEVRITEFMASNTRTLQDEDHDYPDWIEIFNNSLNTVNLGNWSLTDNADNPGKWHFPASHIPCHQVMSAFCSRTTRLVPGC